MTRNIGIGDAAERCWNVLRLARIGRVQRTHATKLNDVAVRLPGGGARELLRGYLDVLEGEEALLVVVLPVVAQDVFTEALESEGGLAADHLASVRSIRGVAVDLEILVRNARVDPHPVYLIAISYVRPLECKDFVQAHEHNRRIWGDDDIRGRCWRWKGRSRGRRGW